MSACVEERMRTVLIIDDNPAVGEALSLLLSLHDIRPLIALTPEDGLAMLERESVDVVIQDMNFTADTTSGEEGVELFRRHPAAPCRPAGDPAHRLDASGNRGGAGQGRCRRLPGQAVG